MGRRLGVSAACPEALARQQHRNNLTAALHHQLCGHMSVPCPWACLKVGSHTLPSISSLLMDQNVMLAVPRSAVSICLYLPLPCLLSPESTTPCITCHIDYFVTYPPCSTCSAWCAPLLLPPTHPNNPHHTVLRSNGLIPRVLLCTKCGVNDQVWLSLVWTLPATIACGATHIVMCQHSHRDTPDEGQEVCVSQMVNLWF